MLASPVRRTKKCPHTEVSNYSVAGMNAQRCHDCGKLTITFVETACVGFWTPDDRLSTSRG